MQNFSIIRNNPFGGVNGQTIKEINSLTTPIALKHRLQQGQCTKIHVVAQTNVQCSEICGSSTFRNHLMIWAKITNIWWIPTLYWATDVISLSYLYRLTFLWYNFNDSFVIFVMVLSDWWLINNSKILSMNLIYHYIFWSKENSIA